MNAGSDARRMTPEIEEALGRPAPGDPASESYIDEGYSAELYQYLRDAPRNYHYTLTPAARRDILRRVSWFLLSKDDRLADLVPLDERTGGAPREELQDELEVPIEYTEVRRNQPCGHVFKRGEGVYRCKSCSMDDTCVLCTRCFQATDHAGHDTSFSVNSGTGGCCDCGDPEAWKIPLRCRHHSSFEELEEAGLDPIISSAGAPHVPGYDNNECPVSVRRSIELTIAVVLEFILETFATSPINLGSRFEEESIMEDAQNAGLAIGDHEKQDRFAIVLWNDEVHSFQDVIDQCMEALQCSHMEAKRTAESVDACGRDVLRVSSSIADLIDIATSMTNVSLSVSIRAARDVFREQLSASLIIWLRDLACCKFRPLARVFAGKVNNQIRTEISYQLCLRWVAPSRNGYLADMLGRLYDYNIPGSDYAYENEDEADIDDDDDDENDDDDDMEEDGQDFYGSAAADTNVLYSGSSAANAYGQQGVMTAPETTTDSAEAHMPAQGLGRRRRRRSESEDSLRQEGEERASPRGYMQAGGAFGAAESNDDIPPSLWLADSARRGNDGMGVPSTIHAAMGAAAGAVDAARTSLARIMQPNAMSNFPPHSAAPGAYPHSGPAADGEGAADPREPRRASPEPPAITDPQLGFDVHTMQHIDRVLRGCGQQRLDWFLTFDLQLWKEVRSGLRELYMATLMLDSSYKMKIALTFARNYPRLSRAFLTQDRAPEHSVLLFSVQLFTAATLSASLVENHCFLYIILDVLKKFFMQPTPDFLRQCGVILCDTDAFRNRRYFHVFHDMRYLAATPQVRNWVSGNHNFLAAYVGFIGLFQGMNPNCRAIHQHVEFEADTWVNAFNVTLQVAKSCRQFAECYGISARDLFYAMRATLRMLHRTVVLMAEENSTPIIRNAQANGMVPQNIGTTLNAGSDANDSMPLAFETHILGTLWGRQYEIVQYDVSTSPISFHHPLHWFMAELFQHVRHLSDDRARDFGFGSLRDMVFSIFDPGAEAVLQGAGTVVDGRPPPPYTMDAAKMAPMQRELLRILDYPVRVCVVMAQIRAGMWVRNGYVIRLQSHHYREVSLRENTYDQDIVMLQFFISIWPDSDHILMTLLDRFGLYEWFKGHPHASRVYDQPQTQSMVEELLNVLIVIVSERHVATGKNALDLARREIVHGCLSPISYSELSKRVPERLAENTEFDNLLQKLSNYRGPTGIMDFGQYELKDEFLDEVDPYFIHYTRNQREEIEEVLRERLKKRARKNGGDGAADDLPEYIRPRLDEIRFGPFQRVGMLLHTPLACQVLFYALLHATQVPAEHMSETMVDEALQLIVLALEDGQRGAIAREIGGPDPEAPGEGSSNVDRGGLWKYALQQGYPAGRGTPMNLLGLVLTLGLKPEMKMWKHKLDHIYHLFRLGGPRIVGCIDEYYANLEATPLGSRVLRSAMEEARSTEDKKLAAKARQDAIMADFANQQQNFMSQFGDEFDDLTDDDDLDANVPEDIADNANDKGKATDMRRVHRPLWANPSGACIVCQEECDGSKPYGTLGLIQANRVVRTAPLADASHVVDILRLPGGLDMPIPASSAVAPTENPEEAAALTPASPTKGVSGAKVTDRLRVMNQISAGAYGAASGLKAFPALYHERGMAASTCGHFMHTRCFTQYCQGIETKRQPHPTRNHPENLHRKEYLCPLCKSLGNVLLPVLPGIVDHDPLVAADRDPERFESSAASNPARQGAVFEQWLQEDWLPFGEVLTTACGKASSRSSSSGSSSGSPVADNTATGSHVAMAAGHSTDTENADSSAAHGTSGISGFAEGFADSIPRLDDILRNASRIPGGLNIHALLSRFLPQLAGSTLGTAQGPERLAIPLSRFVRYLTDSRLVDLGSHHRRHAPTRAEGSGNVSSQCSTPGPTNNTPGQGAIDQASNDSDSKYFEQIEGYQFMYTRLYEVLQNVQRDNYVGLPPASLFDHLSRKKDKAAHDGTPLLHAHRQPHGSPLPAPDAAKDEESVNQDDEDEDEDYMDCISPEDTPTGVAFGGLEVEPAQSALPPFLQNMLDHLRVFGPNGTTPQPGMMAQAMGAGGTPAGHLQDAKVRPYPFDRASTALFTHTMEVLELSHRGARNPPVFDHEDTRNLPSGTLTDGMSESLLMFMHSLSKVPESHYRAMFGPVTAVGRARSSTENSCLTSKPAAQRLEELIQGARLQLSSPRQPPQSPLHPHPAPGNQNELLARTRLEMLRDIGCVLAPFTRSAPHAQVRSFANEQSRWNVGSDDVPMPPFLMQDMFSKFVELSMSLVAPFDLDIWHLTRLFLTAELVRVCVAVGDSLLGEYTGAPRALRIAQSLPFSADGHSSCGHPTPHLSSPDAGQAPNHVPQPWVDAPEARDASLPSAQSSGSDASMLESSSAGIHALVAWAIRQMQGPDADNEALERLRTAAHRVTVTKLVATLILPFLRRVALVLNIQYGLDIAREAPWLRAERHQALGSDDGTQVLPQTEPECARLLKLLHLPALHQLFDPETQPATMSLAEGWLRELRLFRRRHTSPMSLGAGYTMAVPVCMPTPYSLVELPDRFEVLFERSAKALCPRCGGTPNDPALCLLCGSFVCVQNFCCQEDGIGECNMHMKTCGGTIGVYLLVKKCGLVLLHHDNGCFMSAPYLDQHGEVDLGLKRGRPLFINKVRYEEMRRLVLTQKIPVFIARKIDQAFDIGGWVSL
ncbi:E3 ubiquitin-protein ligase ubr1 [Coemansia sp. RSA 552]|nr:E3 ubiquitin-protein ligase ubr1 [Coemansia sp. RSA 552]